MQDSKVKHIDYYINKDVNNMLYAVLREDNYYGFFFDSILNCWSFSAIDFLVLKEDFDFEKIEKSEAIKLANNNNVEILFTKMFGVEFEKDFLDMENKDNQHLREDQIFYTVDDMEDDEIEMAHCIHIYFKNKKFKVTNNIPVKHLDYYDDYNTETHAHYVEHIVFEALVCGLKQKGFTEI